MNQYYLKRTTWLILCLVVGPAIMCIPAWGEVATESFEIAGWKPEPTEFTVWTTWLNTFDFRNGGGDADFYLDSRKFHGGRPSNHRTTAEARFGRFGAPLYPIGEKRTRMGYRMGSNCPVWQGVIELFVRSKPGLNIWNDDKVHYVLFLGDPNEVSLVKTNRNTLAYTCQGTTIELPVQQFKADQWYHLAISWDAKDAPGRLWFTIDGKGITAEAQKPLRPLPYKYLVLGNTPAGEDLRLDGIIDEVRISDETLADRTPEGLAKLAALGVDWVLYERIREAVRLSLSNEWPSKMPYDGNLWNKYGGRVSIGWDFGTLYQAYGDPWFLERAERIGKVLLMAQFPTGHFPCGFHLTPTGKAPLDVSIKPSGQGWAAENQMRIQDGFQDIPMSYLIYLYRLTGKKEYLDGALKVGEVFLQAQNPNGSWSGIYDFEIKKGRIADSRDILNGGEFDDGGISRPFWSLLLLYHVTKDEKYLKPLPKCADWILKAEVVGSGARGWAGFYDANNNPVQSRKHEYPKIYTQVFTGQVGHLMIAAYHLTGDRKYLDGIRPALKWYKEHRDPVKGWTAFYDKDGTPFAPSNYYTPTGWFGPHYHCFQDITYIENALGQLDKGQLRTQTVSLKATPEAIAKLRAESLAQLQSQGTIVRLQRDIHLINKPKTSSASRGTMINYLVAVQRAAGKVPLRLAIPGAPCQPTQVYRATCWLVEDWFDTPLRQTYKK